jgi:hypothetical protein
MFQAAQIHDGRRVIHGGSWSYLSSTRSSKKATIYFSPASSNQSPYWTEQRDRLAPARDTFAVFEDLRLVGNSEHLQSLQLKYICKMFSLELVDIKLTNFNKARVFSVS